MVRKSLRRALALGTSRAVRDEAAIGAACPEPAHGANAGSGKQLFWHFPLLKWHTVLLVPVLGGGCRDMDFLLALTPARCLSGYSAGARSWDGSVRAEPCLLCCLDAGLSSCPLCQFCSVALGIALLQSLFSCPGWASREPLELGRDPSFSVSSSACGDPCLEGGKDGEPSGQQSTQTPWEWLQGHPLPSHTGTALQTEVASPGLSAAGGIAGPVVTSH